MCEYCNPLMCSAYASGWCEYNMFEDRVYPMEPSICPLLKEVQNA